MAGSEPPAGGYGRLDERILATLQDLPGEIAFSGLRRVLRAHPESLTRALRRLEREGLILRGEGGYRALGPGGSPAAPDGEEFRAVAEVELPSHVASEDLVDRLSSRWFGSLRWVGVVERSGERLLAWAPRSGPGLVLLGTRGSRLRVLVPDGIAALDGNDAEDAAYELLFHAVEALRGLGVRGNLATGPTMRSLAQGSPGPFVDN